MAASTLSAVFLILAVVALVVIVLALRHRLAFRLGVRNITRAYRRSALLVVGLLIGTSLIAGSLVVGDTINTLAIHYTVLAVGHDDEAVGNVSPNGGYEPFAYSVYGSVVNATAGDPLIAGIAPEIVGSVSIEDKTTGVPQPNLHFIGTNGNESGALGSFTSDGGATISGPMPGEVLLDDLATSELNASAGDSLVLYGASGVPVAMTVQAVVQDTGRGAFPTGGVGDYGSAFVSLSDAGTVQGTPGMINYLAVSNSGDQATRLSNAPAVSATLNATLAAIPAAHGLTVSEVLRNALYFEGMTGTGVTALFLVFALFSIAAGTLLIVGIFLLLAEERKGEMAVTRALGLRQEELVYGFFFEGVIYAAGSALAGVALGVAIGYGLTYAFSVLLKTPGLTASALQSSFTVLPGSLAIAYVAGFLLTVATVIIASRRASRLNIVRAIRDIPEPPPAVRTYTYWAAVGLALVVLGALLYQATYRGTSALWDPVIGGALVIAGFGLIASRFLKNRIVFSSVGIALLVWGGFEPLRTSLLGTDHGGGIDGVFVEGILLVSGAVLIYAFNSSILAAALVRLVGGRDERAPIAQVGLSYPGRRPGRTTVSLTIFALVSFTLVAIAGAGSSLDASLGAIERQQSGGYSLVAFSAASAPQLPSLVESNATLAPYFSDVVPLETGAIAVAVHGSGAAPYNDSLYAGPTGEPANSNFYSTNQYTYSATWDGWSASKIDQELESDPGVAVVDGSYSTVPNNLATSTPTGHPTVNPGALLDLTNPVNGNQTQVTVVGVMTQSVLGGVFVGPAAAETLGISAQEIFLMGVSGGHSVSAAALAAKKAFFPYGLVVVDLDGAIASSIATTEGEIELLQIFVAMGLVVGIAAMGIVALREVTERRREIGMLRANGFTERMVVRAFLLEYSFVTLVGLFIGTALGLLVIWNLTHSAEATATGITVFALPLSNLALILVVAYGLSMLAVAGPSRVAARLPPAVAVRATE